VGWLDEFAGSVVFEDRVEGQVGPVEKVASCLRKEEICSAFRVG